jgi:hypothetical protein
LQQKCKARDLPANGSKEALVNRLQKANGNGNDKPAPRKRGKAKPKPKALTPSQEVIAEYQKRQDKADVKVGLCGASINNGTGNDLTVDEGMRQSLISEHCEGILSVKTKTATRMICRRTRSAFLAYYKAGQTKAGKKKAIVTLRKTLRKMADPD